MLPSFFISFREGMYCAFLLLLFLLLPEVRKKSRILMWPLMGTIIAFITGFCAGYAHDLADRLPSNETWTTIRFIVLSVLFYLSIIVYLNREILSGVFYRPLLFLTGAILLFFEARAMGFLILDFGLMSGNEHGTLFLSLSGIALGFSPLLLWRYVSKIPQRHNITFPVLLVVVVSFRFMLNGVSELESIAIPAALQRGLGTFLVHAIAGMQSLLLIPDHPYIAVVFSGLGNFLSGERTALSLVVAFLLTPPLFFLVNLFGRPDPILRDININAQRRLKLAFFRRDMVSQALPIIFSFLLLVVMIHASNVSVNPMYDPVPMPARAGEDGKTLVIPLSDNFGEISDGKLRKYVYYYGHKEIIFLAVLKPDGSIGVALDECEICKPADWNKDARGYAQRGTTLVCKYCMTPIPLPTINNPGGCNPVPLPFDVRDGEIVLSLDEFLGTYKKLQDIEKKGTHL